MELILKVDLEIARDKISGDFTTAHHENWEDEENPTDLELTNSLKDEITSWLDNSGIQFEIKDG